MQSTQKNERNPKIISKTLKTPKNTKKTQKNIKIKKFAGPAARGVSDPVFELFLVDFFDNCALPGAQEGEIRMLG